MEKIIGLGNALVDVLGQLDSDKALEETGLPKGGMQLIDAEQFAQISALLRRTKTKCATGGSAGNTIKALASMGAECGFIGKTGKDENGRFFAESFARLGIKTQLAQCDLPTGCACTFITPDGERTFGTHLGAAATLTGDDMLMEMFRGYSFLYIEGYLVQNHQLIRRAIELAKVEGLLICLDLASYNIVEQDKEFFTELVTKYVDIVFANEEEAKAFTGLSGEEAVEPLAKLCTVAVVKLGSKGSVMRKGSDSYFIPCHTVEKVVDTTGAGDYYAAGFLYGLLGGNSLPKCGALGSLLAANIIQEVGATLPDERWNEIKLKTDAILSK